MNVNNPWFLYRQPDASKDIVFVFPCGMQSWYHSNSSIKGTKYGGERPQLAIIKHTVPNEVVNKVIEFSLHPYKRKKVFLDENQSNLHDYHTNEALRMHKPAEWFELQQECLRHLRRLEALMAVRLDRYQARELLRDDFDRGTITIVLLQNGYYQDDDLRGT